jgi:hypothetical protein
MRVLLVDDEQELVSTLAERLDMRVFRQPGLPIIRRHLKRWIGTSLTLPFLTSGCRR